MKDQKKSFLTASIGGICGAAGAMIIGNSFSWKDLLIASLIVILIVGGFYLFLSCVNKYLK